MASSARRSWKLQDFSAHSSKVNCLALGHKSGRVLVTGGDDKKVNLWAVGQQNCIISLSGHSSPIECVKFGTTKEDHVCAGSQTGALRIWDLEHTKLTRALTGHKAAIKCIDFHPYGELLASGGADTAIKLWDNRRKGCIFTYKGHDRIVNSLKFSPDGQWIASAGEEGLVRLWDLRAGKQLKEFSDHKGPATSVEFHPHEFLLASGSSDKTVHFWDLESFVLVSSSELSNTAPVRCMFFSQGGECLFVGCQDVLKVYGWEPARTFDSVPVGWGKVQDIAIAQNQIIGASCHSSNVILYVCDLKKIAPLGTTSTSSPFSYGNSLRKSFSKERPNSLKKLSMDVKTIEEDKSASDPEDEITCADIPNVDDYRNVFQPTRSLTRTPPPPLEAFPEPIDTPEPTIKSQMLRSLSNSMSSLLSSDTQEENDTFPSNSPKSSISLSKPMSVRVHPIKSTPLITRSPMTPISTTSQIRANLQANKNSKNLAPVPPIRQNNTPISTKKNLANVGNTTPLIAPKPLGPQRSNTTLTPRNAPMAAVSPVIDDGKLKSRASSPDNPKQFLKRQQAKDAEHGYDSDFPPKIHNLRHSPSDPQLNRPNTAQTRNLGRNFANNSPLSARNTSMKKLNKAQVAPSPKVEIRVAQLKPSIQGNQREELISMNANKSIDLDPEAFLPKNHMIQATDYSPMGSYDGISETEAMGLIFHDHKSMMEVLEIRYRSLRTVFTHGQNKGVKAAVDFAVSMNDLSVVVDVLDVLNKKQDVWSLDLCNSLLTSIGVILLSKYDEYVATGCTALRTILRVFGPVIKTNVDQHSIHTIGVDVSREERYRKCHNCYEKLKNVRSSVAAKKKEEKINDLLESTFKELVKFLEMFQ